ncbi:MAG: lytic murein transglycosylase, partial [Achromobacter pestifer]
MRQRFSGPRIDTLSRALLAAAVMAAATSAVQAQSPSSATGSRTQSPAPTPVQPTLTPKRTFDDVTSAQEAGKAPPETPVQA